MKTTNKNDLKAALTALDVGTPLRLPSRAPAFRPPPDRPPGAEETPVGFTTEVAQTTGVSVPTPVVQPAPVGTPTGVPEPIEDGTEDPIPVEKTRSATNPTPVEIPTPVAEATPVGTTTKVPGSTPVQIPTPVAGDVRAGKGTPVPAPAPVGHLTPGRNPTPVGNSTGVRDPSVPRRGTEQDSSVVLDAQAGDRLDRGYTRLPNAVLLRLASGDVTRNEIKLALLIARFTISFQRRLAPLSKTVLARRSGLREPAVLEALSGLVAKGIAVKEQGDQHRPNLLGLVLPEGWDSKGPDKAPTSPVAPPAGTSVAQSTPAGNPTGVRNATPAGVGESTGAGAGNPTPFKDRERYLKESTLSHVPENLRAYLDAITAPRKRESEWKALRELQAGHSLDDIADCVAHLQARGIGSGDTAEPCHSPLAFLSKAMGEVLPVVEADRRRVRERTERKQRDAEVERRRAEEEAREGAESARKERAFNKVFPCEERQWEALSGLLRGLPWKPNSVAGRTVGVTKWWDTLSEYDRCELTGQQAT